MGIKARQYTVEGILNQFLVGHRIDVITAHPLEHIPERGEQPLRMAVLSVS